MVRYHFFPIRQYLKSQDRLHLLCGTILNDKLVRFEAIYLCCFFLMGELISLKLKAEKGTIVDIFELSDFVSGSKLCVETIIKVRGVRIYIVICCPRSMSHTSQGLLPNMSYCRSTSCGFLNRYFSLSSTKLVLRKT